MRWTTQRIVSEVSQIDLRYPDEVRTMERPTEWADMYNFFDAHDLWMHGAWNLWIVVQSLFEKAEEERRQIVSDWVWAWLATSANRNKLSRWQPGLDVLDVLGTGDWLEGGVLECSAHVQGLLRRELTKWHQDVCSSPPAGQGRTVQNWVGE